jgi:MoxR-like ATPase
MDDGLVLNAVTPAMPHLTTALLPRTFCPSETQGHMHLDGASPMDAQQLNTFGEHMRQLIAAAGQLFPERDHLIHQIVYALLTREHVLVDGLFGTAKTALMNTIFGAFMGQQTFSITMTKFMTEAHLIGIPDPKELRESGVLRYRPEGGILEANFAELDEILDASPPLLRVLLGILNERRFNRGKQIEMARLHTAIAATNGAPDLYLKADPALGAVLDRFLFWSKVEYLKHPEARLRMYRNFLRGAKLGVQMPFEQLHAAADLVEDLCHATEKDPDIINTYDQLIEAYCSVQTGHVISDRRRCLALKLIGASAVLHGRYASTLEDLMAVRWALCVGNDPKQHEVFAQMAQPIVDTAILARQQTVDQLQNKLLDEYAARIPTVPQHCSPAALVDLYKRCHALHKDLEGVKPQLPSTSERQQTLLERVSTLIADVHAQLSS